jgi:crotonobetainyl-CoA:carnitine CoA-transferase CaiB-like acyl-CoA transferase
MFQPLKGIRVVDMSHVIAGPLSSFYLAQLGCEVIKIEPAQGDAMRGNHATKAGGTPDDYVALNAGKRSTTFDIRTPEGADTVRRLAVNADVFIENFRPGKIVQYGLDEAAIREINPNVIYCSISGYGQQGEWSGRGAYDHVVQALTGMMMMSGDDPQGPPVKVGFPVVDVAAGLLAAFSITAALHQRKIDGKGQTIDASMVQASLMLMYPNASTFLSSGIEPRRMGNRGYTGSPTADTYRCVDGWLATAANTAGQFRKLANLLGLDALCEDAAAIDLDSLRTDGGFVVARDVDFVRGRFSAAFAVRSAAEMETRLNQMGVPAARVRTLGEFLREIDGGDKLSLGGLSFKQGDRIVRTPGLGFSIAGHAATTTPRPGAEPLGHSTRELFEATRIVP